MWNSKQQPYLTFSFCQAGSWYSNAFQNSCEWWLKPIILALMDRGRRTATSSRSTWPYPEFQVSQGSIKTTNWTTNQPTDRNIRSQAWWHMQSFKHGRKQNDWRSISFLAKVLGQPRLHMTLTQKIKQNQTLKNRYCGLLGWDGAG